MAVDWRSAAALSALARAGAADVELVGVEDGRLGVDVQAEDVEVAVLGQDLALQQAPARGGGHSSTPPDLSSAPSAKWGRSLFSYMDSAEPIAMCMSRYL